MQKRISIIICLFLLVLPFSLQAKSNKWQDALIGLKTKVAHGKVPGKKPVFSDVMRHKEPAQKLEFDLTGVESIVLTTNGTLDGTNWDHAVFADPRLTDVDGNIVYLSDLEHVSAKAPHGSPIFNKHFNGGLSIAGKKYSKGILLHSNGIITYDLDKKYTKLEVEVGIDDKSNRVGSAIFKIQDALFNEDELLNTLSPNYVEKITEFLQKISIPIDALLNTVDGSTERSVVENVMSSLKNKSYFEAEIEKYENLPSKEKLRKYIDLASLAMDFQRVSEDFVWVNPEAISLYLEDMKTNEKFDYPKYKAMLDKMLTTYESVNLKLMDGDFNYISDAKEILKLRKQILLANPLLDSDKIVVARFNLGDHARSDMAPKIGSAPANWSSMYSARTRGFDAELSEISNLRADELSVRTIYKPKNKENIADLQMHWNADALLFSSVDKDDKWQIYEVGLDGGNFHKKIDIEDADVEFCDANYLPDGRVVASSSIGYNGVPCVNGSDVVGNLTIYDPENGDFRRLTFDQDGNWNPTVMNNGRLMYTRWEYTDLTHYFSRIVMHMNPDGTENKALYGSGSFWPNSTFDIKPLPGHPTQFIGVISGHHGVARSGRLMIFDPTKSRKEAEGVVQELPFRNREVIPEIKDELVDGDWPQFIRPCPLNDKYFLVAAKISPKSLWGVYLVDIYDNLTCIAEFEGEGLNSPIMVEKSPVPPVIPDRVNLNDKQATVFIQDIYQGEGSDGIPKGEIKELRILAYEYAYWHSPSDHDAQGIQSGWDIKRLLGTVPVEEDGSVIFTVPANVPIALQPIDKAGRALQWMRSWFTAMPGETVSCIGCHEDLNQIPIPKRVVASQRKPHPITSPEGGVRSFTYELEMQPILDRACISCHNEESSLNLTAKTYTKYPRHKRPWSHSYLAIMPFIYRQGPEAEMYVLEPYEYHASNSELVRLLEKGHYGVELTDKEWRTFYNWIDFNAPYHGQFMNISKQNGFDQYERRIELANKYNNGAGVDWRKEIEDYAKYLEAKEEIVPVMPPRMKEPKAKKIRLSSWPMTLEEAESLQSENGETRRTIEIADGIKLNFIWVPNGSFIMGDEDFRSDAYPQFKTKVKDGFWMSETEISNEQYCALVPEHDSRVFGQQWKDHTTAGYWANLPEQPVIRVSYEDVKVYCEMLSKKLGLEFNIPTETQWEWASRAGTDTDFWYGTSNTDFAKFENMADAQLSNMAVTGIDPQPMSPNSSLRKYWDFIPKISTVDDGNMVTSSVGSYMPNAWGLKDMHGNVAEWTRTDYVPYPLKGNNDSSDRKVVRGGSWMDRPKYSSSHSRKAFYPWQRVYNVGFRMIITD